MRVAGIVGIREFAVGEVADLHPDTPHLKTAFLLCDDEDDLSYVVWDGDDQFWRVRETATQYLLAYKIPYVFFGKAGELRLMVEQYCRRMTK